MIRRVILWLTIAGFIWLAIRRYHEIAKLAEILRTGQWQWVIAAVLLQILYYIIYALTYQAAFYTVGLSWSLRRTLPVLFGSLLVNVITPSAGMAGTALFVDDAQKHGESPARAAAGTLLVLVSELGTFGIILITGIAYLLHRGDLHAYQIIGALVLTALFTTIAGLLFLSLKRPSVIGRLLAWIEHGVLKLQSWVHRPQLPQRDWAQKLASEFSAAAAAIGEHPRRLLTTLSIALAAHVLDLASLYVLFLAFRHAVTLEVLITGYAMGILFWIVSITPQGIGVVEGVMVLVFSSLGVPPAKATLTSVSWRGLTFWIPLVIGFFTLRKLKSFDPGESSRHITLGIRLVAVLVAVTGIVDIASAISPSVAVRTALLARFLPMEARQGARLAAAFAGFVLVTLATNLWRRKHMAWLLAIILLGISATSHLLKGLDYEEAVLSIVIMVWLWHLRHYFYAKSDSPSIVQGLRSLIYALTFTLAYGTAGFYLLDRHFKIHFDFWSAVKQTVVMFARFYDPGLQPVTAYGQRFADSIYVLGAVSMVYAIIMVFRPVLVRKPASEEETAHAKQIVERWGRSSLARLTLLPDKSYLFTADGSVIAYVLNNRVALTLGDPIGPPQSIPAAICEFRELCLRNDWYPAFYQTLPEYLEHYKAAGFDTLRIGQEAIVRLSSFTLEGKSGRRLRPSVNRLVKTGHFTLLHEPPLSDGLLDQLHIISDEWLRHVKGSEKRFSLGWFDDDYIRSCPVMTVHASDGTAVAFANIMTEYQLNEITVDLMRYSRRAEPGTMDFLFVSLLEWAKEKGYESFNLGLSPLAGVGQRSEDPMIERAMHFIYEHLGQFYSYKGLYSFKSKFNPTWEDRYLVYPGAASLPTVVISVIQADSGGNLILGYLRKAIWQRAMTYPPTGTET